MRVLVSVLAVSTLLLGIHALAVGDDGDTKDRSNLKTETRLKALELEVEYLRSREAATSAYVLANQQRARDLDVLAKEVRRLGFATARIQISSRRALLDGLEQLAVKMATGLPVPTAEDAVLLKQIDALLK